MATAQAPACDAGAKPMSHAERAAAAARERPDLFDVVETPEGVSITRKKDIQGNPLPAPELERRRREGVAKVRAMYRTLLAEHQAGAPAARTAPRARTPRSRRPRGNARTTRGPDDPDGGEPADPELDRLRRSGQGAGLRHVSELLEQLLEAKVSSLLRRMLGRRRRRRWAP